MLISIGSRSIPKITAITRAFSRYPELWIENGDKIEYMIMLNIWMQAYVQFMMEKIIM